MTCTISQLIYYSFIQEILMTKDNADSIIDICLIYFYKYVYIISYILVLYMISGSFG